jgi:hypothetical protein
LGRRLLCAFADEARRRGFRHIAGHWRQGASANLIRGAGGTARLTLPRYHGTDEAYEYVVLDL